MQNHIDLRPLLGHRAAMEMLLLARGQLNQAFRTHGLMSPDPLCVRAPSRSDTSELDAPSAFGIEHARARFGEEFDIWAEEMPRQLAHPVLDILWQALQALEQHGGASEANAAVLKAHQFLSSQVAETDGLVPNCRTKRSGTSPASPGRFGLGGGEAHL